MTANSSAGILKRILKYALIVILSPIFLLLALMYLYQHPTRTHLAPGS